MIQFRLNKKNLWLAALIASIFAWVAWINFLPTGFVVSSTDHAFFLDIKNAYKSFFYTWTNNLGYGAGRAYNLQAAIPYYTIWRAAAIFDLAPHVQQSLYFLLFLVSSFASFALALKMIFPDMKNQRLRVFFSLLYSFNLYTLYLFMHVFGYFYQQVLFVFAPLFIAYVYKILTAEATVNVKREYLALTFLYLIGSMSFNNPGFLVSYIVIILLIGAIVIFFNGRRLGYTLLIYRLLLIGTILFVTNAYWLLPYFAVLKDQATNLTDGNAIWTMQNWISWQSTKLSNLFRMIPVTDDSKFPVKFYYDASPFFKAIYNILSFSYLALIPLGLLLQKKIKQREISFLALLAILTLLITKYKGPLGEFSIKVFSLPILNSLRSYDKFMVFWPALVLIIVFALIIMNERIRDSVKYLIVVILLLLPLPFYAGKLQQHIALIFKEGENFQTAKYSYLVKVPDDYRRISQIVNGNDASDYKVQYLPFGVINSPGWSQYPKWKFMGNDITASLFEKPVLRPSNYLNSQQFNYGKLFNSKYDPSWMMTLSGLLNESYLVFNKDVDEQFLVKAQPKIKTLEERGDISEKFSGEYASLYKINPEYFLPHFYAPTAIIYGQNVGYDMYPELLNIDIANDRPLYLLETGNSPNGMLTELSRTNSVPTTSVEQVRFSEISVFDFNSDKISLAIEDDTKLYYGGVPIKLSVTVNDEKISLTKKFNKNDYAAINGKSDYANELYQNLELKNSAKELVLNDFYVQTSKLNQRFELNINSQNPDLKISTDFSNASKNLIKDASFEQALANGANSCGRGDPNRPVEIGAQVNLEATQGKQSLQLVSRNGRACSMLMLPASEFDAESFYRFSVDYKNIKGGKVEFGIWQAGAKLRQPELKQMSNDLKWHHYEYVFKPKSEAGQLTVFLYADSNGQQETINLYDNVVLKKVKPNVESVRRLYSEKMLPLAASSTIQTLEVSFSNAAQREIQIDGSFEKILGNGANLCGSGDASRPTDIRSEESADATDGRRSLKLSSSNGNACTMLPGVLVNPGNVYRLSLDYKSLAGQRVKFGVWQPGAGVSLPQENMEVTDRNWHHYEKMFQPLDGADKLIIFLYADSDGTQEVSNLYDNVKLTPIAFLPQKIYSQKNQKTNWQAPAKIIFKKINPTKYKISVQGAYTAFPLVFSEAFHKNWLAYAVPKINDQEAGAAYISDKIKGVIQNNNLRDDRFVDLKSLWQKNTRANNHFLANGYANGWIVNTDALCRDTGMCTANEDGSINIDLVVEYWPQWLFYAGLVASGLALLLSFIYLINIIMRKIWHAKS